MHATTSEDAVDREEDTSDGLDPSAVGTGAGAGEQRPA